MARFKNKPKNRDEFTEYVLRRLGHPVIEVEIADVQLDDVVDDSIETFNLFHTDGAFRTYRKIEITKEMIENNKTVPSLNLPTDASAVSPLQNISSNSYEGNVGLDASNDTYLDTTGKDFTETRESLTAGIKVPDDIMAVVRVFRMSMGSNGSNWMSGEYQTKLGIYDNFGGASANVGGSGLASRQTWLANYEIQMRYLQEIDHSLNYEPPIRFNKVRGRIHIDMSWEDVCAGDYLVFEVRQAIDPEVFPDIWTDRWLRDYATSLAKIQWGMNLMKYNGVNLPGGVTLNGEAILNEGKEEKLKAEEDLDKKFYGLMTPIFVG